MSTFTSEITVYQKAPFSIDYQDVISWKNEEDREKFFDNENLFKKIYENKTSAFIEKDGQIQVSGSPIDFEHGVYLKFKNNVDNNVLGSRTWYAFLTNATSINYDSSLLHYEIDFWTTYYFDFTKQSFSSTVIQSHLKTNEWINRLQNINCGNYYIKNVETIKSNQEWLVFVMKSSCAIGSNDKYQNKPSFMTNIKAFRYFVVPLDESKLFSLPFIDSEGAYYYGRSINEVIENMSNKFESATNTNTVNQVVNMYVSKDIGIEYKKENGMITIPKTDNQYIVGQSFSDKKVPDYVPPDNNDGYDVFPPELTTQEQKNAWIVWTWGKKNGFTEQAISGIMGNIEQESHFNPEAQEGEGIVNKGYGIVQWTASGNFSGLTGEQYVKTLFEASGIEGNYNELLPQLELLNWHAQQTGKFGQWYVTESYPYTWQQFKQLESVDTATRSFEAEFERPLDLHTERVTMAIKWYDWFKTLKAENNQLQAMIGWFKERENKVGYSQSFRLGGNAYGVTCYDCSSALFYALIHAKILPEGTFIGNTETLYTYGGGLFKEISREDLQFGDIFIAGGQGQSSGNNGHCGAIIDKNTIISCHGPDGGPPKSGISEQPNTTSYTNVPVTFYRIDLSSATRDVTTNTDEYEGVNVLEVRNISAWEQHETPLFNIKQRAKELLAESIGINPNELDNELVTDEFVKIKLCNAYGDEFYYNINFIPDKEIKLIINGSISDTNIVHYTLSDYNTIGSNLDRNMYGILDNNPRSLTVVNDISESYMQSNKNSIEAKRLSFYMQKDQLNKSTEINTISSMNSVNNAQWQADQTRASAIFGGLSSASSLIPVIGGGLPSLVGAFSMGGNLASSFSNVEHSQDLANQTSELSNKQLTLSNLQAKDSYMMSVKSFNASLKDLESQPQSIQNVGTDISYNTGNNLDDIYVVIMLPESSYLTNAYNYVKKFGVVQNIETTNTLNYLNKRKYYNYVKLSNIELPYSLDIMQDHQEMIKQILVSGVRVWNGSDESFEGFYKSFTIYNEDKDT